MDVPGVFGGFAEVQRRGVAVAERVVDRGRGRIGIGRCIGGIEGIGNDVFAGIKVQLCIQFRTGAGLHTAGGDLDHAIGTKQLVAGRVHQVAVGCQRQLAVTRVDGLRAIGEGEETVAIDGQVQAVVRGGQAA
ncbi:hypothetical protein D3C79_859950 [compost metagenome]